MRLNEMNDFRPIHMNPPDHQFDSNTQQISNYSSMDKNQNRNIENNPPVNEQEKLPEIIPERQLNSYLNNPFLTDASIKKDDIELPIHRVILCSASNYLNDYFRQNPDLKDKVSIPIPDTVESSYDKANKKDCLNIIMKYCYNNQDYNSIKDQVTRDNIFTILSLSHALGIGALNKNLERAISQNFLDNSNMIKLANESILYDLHDLHRNCLDKIKKNIGSLNKSTAIKELMDFNYNMFKDFVSSDEVDFEGEKDIVDIVREYIKNRRSIEPVVEKQVEQVKIEENKEIVIEQKVEGTENPNPEEVKKEEEKKEEETPNPNGEEEKKDEEKKEEAKEEEGKEEEKKEEAKEEEAKEEGKEEEKKEEAKEEEKKEEEKKNVLETVAEVKESLEMTNFPTLKGGADLLNNWKKHLEEVKKELKPIGLTKEQERELMLCIRFSFLNHPDLIELTNDPIINEHKDLILQGLSVRLNNYENKGGSSPNLLINLTPRKYLRFREDEANSNQALNGNKINNSNNENSNQMSNNNYPPNSNLNMFNNNRYDSNSVSQNRNAFSRTTPLNQPPTFDKNQNNNYNSATNFNNPNPMNLTNMQSANFNPMQSNMNHNFPPNQMDIENSNNYMYNNEVLNIDEMNNKKKKLQTMMKSAQMHPPQDPKISIDFFRNQSMLSRPRPFFKYTYDFDENGALYFLGTKGKKSPYRNPHEISVVRAFASSVSKGEISDFVGRNLVNLRTENEENSFFGVDLGEERTLIPTAYSIRNRNSSSHVMLCWNLEASNDKINFEVIDTRIFSNASNPTFHKKLENERNMLKNPGCTSTWGISKKVREKFPGGFRYFLIKQIDKNSNGSYNLAISGFELYGEGQGKGWFFN